MVDGWVFYCMKSCIRSSTRNMHILSIRHTANPLKSFRYLNKTHTHGRILKAKNTLVEVLKVYNKSWCYTANVNVSKSKLQISCQKKLIINF